MTPEITALVASAVALATLATNWWKDRNSDERHARNDAAEWYAKWQEAERQRLKDQRMWQEKCDEMQLQIAQLMLEVHDLRKNR